MEKLDTGWQKGLFNSDLAIERRRADPGEEGVALEREARGDFAWERIKISTIAGARSIGRPIGHYDTLTLPCLSEISEGEIYDGADEISRELCRLFDKNGIFPERLLVVGLGNPDLTPDAIGPKAADMTVATLHLKEICPESFYDLECSEIAVFSPGVRSVSGIESGLIVKSVCERLRPDAVIAIDAIATSSRERLGRTVQISDTGIFPGSGLGLRETPLDKERLGTPVIAIGVPTVISSGSLTEGDKREKFDNMFFAPKDIDGIVKNAARVIGYGINQAFGIFE